MIYDLDSRIFFEINHGCNDHGIDALLNGPAFQPIFSYYVCSKIM